MNDLTLDNPLDHNAKPVKVGDEMTPLEVSTDKLWYQKTPTDIYEVANKKYVDDNAGGSSNFSYIVSSGFNYSSTGGTKVYLPLNGYIFESSSNAGRNEYQAIVMPHNGYLSKVIMRSEEACGSTVVGLHKSSDNTEIPNATASNTVTVDMSADDIGYTFTFGESASFNAGDVVSISFDPTNDANDTIGTTVFILDGNT
tara:strand:+ start:1586 stop:2182 length:597 start_codon:yes stop_codon:yes gene_type:complete